MGFLALACSASSSGTGFSSGSGGSGGNSSSNTASGTGNGDSAAAGDFTAAAGTTSTSGSGIGEGCASTTSKAQQLPLDMYIMLDKSGSMDELTGSNKSKWDEVTLALQTFLAQPNTAGIGVGIQYFPRACPSACDTAADCGVCGGSCGFFTGCSKGGSICQAAMYANPAVEIAPLPGAAAALITSIKNEGPGGGTPTSAALSGAVQHAKTWAQQHPTHVTIAVFATDGEPMDCDTNSTNINAIASGAANGSPKILTFVIGVGSSLTSLNALAAAGGTGQAFLVDTTQNPGQQFLDAMNKIRGGALACSYSIPAPESGTPDFTKVNVQYTPGSGGAAVTFPKAEDKAHCVAGADAWYYDNNAAPTQIILCDSTCSTVSKDTKGQIDILLGCDTVTVPK